MITHIKEVGKRYSEKSGFSQEHTDILIKILFQYLRENLNNPNDLAYEFPGLGTFIMRFSKFEGYAHNTINKGEASEEYVEYLNQMLTKIEEFREAKKTKRNARFFHYHKNEKANKKIRHG